MFAFNSKNFFGKKKTSIRVEDGEWSSRFSLDVAGSSGVVACKCGDRLYQVSSNPPTIHRKIFTNSFGSKIDWSSKSTYIQRFIETNRFYTTLYSLK